MDDPETYTPQWSDLVYLLEPSALLMVGTAVTVVVASSFRALTHELSLAKQGVHRDEGSITLDGSHAVLMPVVSSITLLVVFYFFASIAQIMVLFCCISAVGALAFAAAPVTDWVKEQANGSANWLHSQISCGAGFDFTTDQVILGGIGTTIVLGWLLSGHWILNNVLGTCLCVSFISFVRLPNLKVCASLLGALFVYDIFWVFFSERFFGANVMVAAATKQASNPVWLAAEALHVPVSSRISQKLDLPVKLLFPRHLLSQEEGASDSFMMLGLGDMALPGMALALLLCHDYRRASKRSLPASGSAREGGLWTLARSPRFWSGSLLLTSTCGYGLGLVTALAAGILSSAAQPALLYIVPCTLVPVMLQAWARGELQELWSGHRPSLLGKQEHGGLGV